MEAGPNPQDGVQIEVFDEPDMAIRRHRQGLARLFALQVKEAVKYLEKNIPDMQLMGAAYMQVGRGEGGAATGGGGTVEQLRNQIVALAIDRAFLMEPLPTNSPEFDHRLQQGRGRLTLIANEVARLAGTILLEFAAASRKIKDVKSSPAALDAAQQVAKLVPLRFLQETPWTQLQHLPRYLKAVVLRFEKLKADPARDVARMEEVKLQEQRFWRLVAQRKGVRDARAEEFRWLLEELRVSFFAQELRTPQPVSTKRLDKAWGQLQS